MAKRIIYYSLYICKVNNAIGQTKNQLLCLTDHIRNAESWILRKKLIDVLK